MKLLKRNSRIWFERSTLVCRLMAQGKTLTTHVREYVNLHRRICISYNVKLLYLKKERVNSQVTLQSSSNFLQHQFSGCPRATTVIVVISKKQITLLGCHVSILEDRIRCAFDPNIATLEDMEKARKRYCSLCSEIGHNTQLCPRLMQIT
eukprot:IDg15756t1